MKKKLSTDQIEVNVTTARLRVNRRNGKTSRVSDNAERCLYVAVAGAKDGSWDCLLCAARAAPALLLFPRTVKEHLYKILRRYQRSQRIE
jgi:hypothetical protein